MNNITKYRKLIINALLVLGIAGVFTLMKVDNNKKPYEGEQAKLKPGTESISTFEMVTLKFL